jgi:hypothetical protein
MKITISVKGHFYDITESDMIKNASACKCNRFDCFNCCCRKEMIRKGYITSADEDNFLFNGITLNPKTKGE